MLKLKEKGQKDKQRSTKHIHPQLILAIMFRLFVVLAPETF
jgi:hypothetical protein